MDAGMGISVGTQVEQVKPGIRRFRVSMTQYLERGTVRRRWSLVTCERSLAAGETASCCVAPVADGRRPTSPSLVTVRTTF